MFITNYFHIFANECAKYMHMKSSNYPSIEEFYSNRMLPREQMEHDRDLAEQYLKILKQASVKDSPLYVNGAFVSHGVTMCCDNPIGGILITGINPSSNSKFPYGGYYTFRDAIQNGKSYWKNKREQIFGNDNSLIETTAYLDLFPYSESSQNKFQYEIDNNLNLFQYKYRDGKDKNLKSFQVSVLEITLSEIERLSPKLIIAANKQTSYYWGIKKDSTWLGYNLQIVDKSQQPDCLLEKDINLYQIVGKTGFKDADDRIGQDKYPAIKGGKSNLLGAYFIDYALYDNRHKKKYPKRILEPYIVKELYDIVNNSPHLR